ncbi:corticoliberin-like [Vombatus ursinus]|uniref:Corticoliberin n=1 Tax=Vombatus ursinus TaxID=29139 RepID=A0A4X2LZN0_VOMUR|nr:corticoliberin-like [Vombatus ursinus]XP_027732598.1 corticoliberin-like [Vombatus ursinus]
MKLQLLVSIGILLVTLLPCQECRALISKGSASTMGSAAQPLDFFQPPPPPPNQQQPLPLLLRMGEEYFLRLGNLNKSPAASFSSLSSSSPSSPGINPGSHFSPEVSVSNFFRGAVQRLQHLQLPQRSLDSQAGLGEGGAESTYSEQREAMEREKRSEEPPISLDLTFHLLREVLEMARAEQLAQQAHSNRKLMEIIGK